jgi:hypothetical protein
MVGRNEPGPACGNLFTRPDGHLPGVARVFKPMGQSSKQNCENEMASRHRQSCVRRTPALPLPGRLSARTPSSDIFFARASGHLPWAGRVFKPVDKLSKQNCENEMALVLRNAGVLRTHKGGVRN